MADFSVNRSLDDIQRSTMTLRYPKDIRLACGDGNQSPVDSSIEISSGYPSGSSEPDSVRGLWGLLPAFGDRRSDLLFLGDKEDYDVVEPGPGWMCR